MVLAETFGIALTAYSSSELQLGVDQGAPSLLSDDIVNQVAVGAQRDINKSNSHASRETTLNSSRLYENDTDIFLSSMNDPANLDRYRHLCVLMVSVAKSQKLGWNICLRLQDCGCCKCCGHVCAQLRTLKRTPVNSERSLNDVVHAQR